MFFKFKHFFDCSDNILLLFFTCLSLESTRLRELCNGKLWRTVSTTFDSVFFFRFPILKLFLKLLSSSQCRVSSYSSINSMNNSSFIPRSS